VPIRKIGGLAAGRMTFEGRRVDLRRFERRPGELLLAEDLLARHLINLVRGRLIIANEIEIAQIDGKWEVVGVDPGRRPFLRRVLGQKIGQRVKSEAIVDFASIEPFVAHVPSARLRIPIESSPNFTRPRSPTSSSRRATKRARRSSKRSVSIENSRRRLRRTRHRASVGVHRVAQRQRSGATLVAHGADNAADLINEVEQDRRLPILEHLPSDQQTKVRQLLSYNAESAGGLMNPTSSSCMPPATVDEALEAIRTSKVPPSRCTSCSSSTRRSANWCCFHRAARARSGQ